MDFFSAQLEVFKLNLEVFKDAFIVAWTFMKLVFFKIVDGIVGHFEWMINMIVKGINLIIRAVNKLRSVQGKSAISFVKEVSFTGGLKSVIGETEGELATATANLGLSFNRLLEANAQANELGKQIFTGAPEEPKVQNNIQIENVNGLDAESVASALKVTMEDVGTQ